MLANNWHPEVAEEVLIRKPGWEVLVSASVCSPVLLFPPRNTASALKRRCGSASLTSAVLLNATVEASFAREFLAEIL